jgi:hypothetical protein
MAGLDPITSVADAVGDGVKLVLQKDAQLNTPAEILARQSDQVRKLKDAIKSAIEKGDMDEIRRLCA